jgi:hypothetical protein
LSAVEVVLCYLFFEYETNYQRSRRFLRSNQHDAEALWKRFVEVVGYANLAAHPAERSPGLWGHGGDQSSDWAPALRDDLFARRCSLYELRESRPGLINVDGLHEIAS